MKKIKRLFMIILNKMFVATSNKLHNNNVYITKWNPTLKNKCLECQLCDLNNEGQINTTQMQVLWYG